MTKLLLLLCLLPTLAFGQSVPNGGAVSNGQVWTVAQWMNAWQSKADTASPIFTGGMTLNGVGVPTNASPAFTGTITLNGIGVPVTASPAFTGTMTLNGVNVPTVASPAFTGTPTIGGVAIPTVSSPAFTGSPTIGGVPIPTYPQTAAEISASVTPTNYTYPAGNVLRYGANSTPGTTDMTAAFQAAGNAWGATGGRVAIPAGTYLIAGSVNYTNPVLLAGDGSSATTLTTNSAVNNVVTFNANDSGMENIGFNASVTRTTGNYVSVINGSNFHARKYKMFNYAVGVFISGGSTDWLDSAIYYSPAANAVGILLTGGTGDVYIDHHTISNAALVTTAVGIQVQNATAVNIVDCDIIHHGTSLLLNPGNGQTAGYIWAMNDYFDSGVNGVSFSPTGTGIVQIVHIIGSESNAHTGPAVLFNTGGTINGVDIVNLISASDPNNIQILAGSDIHINGLAAQGSASLVNSGVNVAAGVSSWSVTNSRIGAAYGRPGKAIGINVAPGASNNYIITGNDLTGNTSNLLDGGTGTSKLVNNNLGVPFLSGTTGSIGGGALAAGSCASGTVAITGLTTTMSVTATPVTYPGDGNTWMAYTSAAGTATVKVCAITAGTPTASAYNVRALQ